MCVLLSKMDGKIISCQQTNNDYLQAVTQRKRYQVMNLQILVEEEAPIQII